MAKHNLLGSRGETLAEKWLTGKGYIILHRNWRYSHYEIDIVASKENVLHFIEVKTRSGKAFGEPEQRVGKKKIRNLMKAGEEYQYQFPGWNRVQCDVLSLYICTSDKAEYFFIQDVYLY